MTDATDSGDLFRLAPRPLRRVPDPPSASALSAPKRALIAAGWEPEAAAGLLGAVVAPQDAAGAIEAATKHRIPGGELLVARVEVYAARVIADPGNPRIGTSLAYPVSGVSPRVDHVPLPAAESVATTHLRMSLRSFGQLQWQLAEAMRLTRINVPKPPISEQGIMEPPLACLVKYEAEGEAQYLLTVKEGSSRLSHAQAILGVTASDLLSTYTHATRLRRLVSELNALTERDATQVSASQQARLRVAVIAIDVVVGFQADNDAPMDLLAAVEAKVAQDHVNHKLQWGDEARDDLLAEKCLLALRDGQVLPQEEYLWLSGRLTPDEAVTHGYPGFPDERWTHLISIFTARRRRIAAVVRGPIAAVLEDTGRSAVNARTDKVPLAVAIAMRVKRGAGLPDVALQRLTSVLQAGLPSAVLTSDWDVSEKPLAVLRDEALEAARSRKTSSASSLELSVRALWYMAEAGQLGTARHDSGTGGDRRPPSELVEGMLSSERGVHQLYQAVLDGRDGAAARLVDDHGVLLGTVLGTEVPLSQTDVRTVIVPMTGPVTPSPRDASEVYEDAVATLVRRCRDLEQAAADVDAVVDEFDRPIALKRGIPRASVQELIVGLSAVQTSLSTWAIIADMHGNGQA